MCDSHRFAVDVLELICRRFESKADDLRRVAETALIKDWLIAEAHLACKLQQPTYPFCEVTAKPPYGGTDGEGVRDEDDNPCLRRGDLRVGATFEKGDHRWVFAEFAVLCDGNRDIEKWRRKTEKSVSRLRRLRWVNSISLLIMVVVSPESCATPEGLDVWNRPALAEPFRCALQGGGTLVVKAFDVKCRESDVRSC